MSYYAWPEQRCLTLPAELNGIKSGEQLLKAENVKLRWSLEIEDGRESEWKVVKHGRSKWLEKQASKIWSVEKSSLLCKIVVWRQTWPGSTGNQREGKSTLSVGDYLVRYIKRDFCTKDRKRGMRVCFLGAGTGDILDWMGHHFGKWVESHCLSQCRG